MGNVPSLCRCALVALVVCSLPVVSFAQFGGGESKPEENPFGLAAGGESSAEAAAPADASEPPSFCQCVGETNSQSVARINKALAGPLKEVGLEFQDEPLESVVNFLQSDYNIPVQMDVKAMEDSGLSPDQPITIKVRNVSLKSALRLMLRPKNLTYIVANEVLIITTPDEAESQLLVCVYDVRDLVSARNATKELEKLANVVTACVAMETWAENGGGEAEVHPLRPGLLVVSQTRAVHEEIVGLFAAMRKILAGPTPGSSPPRAMRGLRGGDEFFPGRGDEYFMGRGYEGYGRGSGAQGGYGGRGGYAPQQAE